MMENITEHMKQHMVGNDSHTFKETVFNRPEIITDTGINTSEKCTKADFVQSEN